MIFGLGVFLFASGGYPNRFGEEARVVFAKLEQDEINSNNTGLELPETKNPSDIRLEKIPKWGADLDSGERFLVWGDSHARAPIYAIHEEMSRRGVSGYAVIHHSTPPLVGFNHKMGLGLPNETGSNIAQKVLDLVREHKIRYVLLCGYWSIYQDAIGESRLVNVLQNTINQLHETGAKVYLMADWPDQDLDPLRVAILRHAGFPVQWMPAPRTLDEHLKRNSAIINMANSDGDFVVIDPVHDFLEPGSKSFFTWYDGWPVYSDSQHITFHAAKVLLKKTLTQIPPVD
jgi:hypothetical protein